MAGSLNKVMIIGNLGADPEIRTMSSGDKVANFSIATSERWKDKDTGEKQERTEWHRVVVWNQGLVKVIESYLKKGAKIYIEGQLETRKWTDDSGNDRYMTEIVLRNYRGELHMLDGKKSDAPPPNENSDPQQAQSTAPETTAGVADDDEIPF